MSISSDFYAMYQIQNIIEKQIVKSEAKSKKVNPSYIIYLILVEFCVEISFGFECFL